MRELRRGQRLAGRQRQGERKLLEAAPSDERTGEVLWKDFVDEAPDALKAVAHEREVNRLEFVDMVLTTHNYTAINADAQAQAAVQREASMWALLSPPGPVGGHANVADAVDVEVERLECGPAPQRHR